MKALGATSLSEAFVNAVLSQMVKKKITSYRLAKDSELDPSTVNRILHRQINTVTLHTVEKIAAALKVPAADLVSL